MFQTKFIQFSKNTVQKPDLEYLRKWWKVNYVDTRTDIEKGYLKYQMADFNIYVNLQHTFHSLFHFHRSKRAKSLKIHSGSSH